MAQLKIMIKNLLVMIKIQMLPLPCIERNRVRFDVQNQHYKNKANVVKESQ